MAADPQAATLERLLRSITCGLPNIDPRFMAYRRSLKQPSCRQTEYLGQIPHLAQALGQFLGGNIVFEDAEQILGLELAFQRFSEFAVLRKHRDTGRLRNRAKGHLLEAHIDLDGGNLGDIETNGWIQE